MSAALLRKALQQLGESRLTVRGNSMEPTIKDGDTVTIRAEPFLSIAEGDVIAYQSRSAVVIHRVVCFLNGVAYAAGDANVLIDSEPITPQNYIGKVVRVRRGNENIERPVLGYKRRCGDLVKRKKKRSHKEQVITIWLPVYFADIRLREFYEHERINDRVRIIYKILKGPPFNLVSDVIRGTSVGISPWGLYPERCLRALLPSINHIFFMANFGPRNSEYFPADL